MALGVLLSSLLWLTAPVTPASDPMWATASANDTQQPPCAVHLKRLRRYRELVDTYVSDGGEEVGRQVEGWTDEDLDAAVAALVRLSHDALPCEVKIAEWRGPAVAAAALMHADMAFAGAPSEADPEHLERGERLLDALGVRADLPALRPRWRLEVACRFRQRLMQTETERYLSRAKAALDEERGSGGAEPQVRRAQALLHLLRGSLAEANAGRDNSHCLSIQQCASPGKRDDYRAEEQARARWRRQALDQYRRAVEADDGPEPRLRLGRALALDGRLDEAAAELAGVAAEGHDPYYRQLGLAFLARVREQQGRWSDAVTAYRAALRVHPEAQAARVGLAHALQRLGRERARLQALAPLLDESVPFLDPAPLDPWWMYFSGPRQCHTPTREVWKKEGLLP